MSLSAKFRSASNSKLHKRQTNLKLSTLENNYDLAPEYLPETVKINRHLLNILAGIL